MAMKKLLFGDYVIGADLAATREYYGAQPNYLVKCACVGCQNFFKSAAAHKNELDEVFGSLGADWKKPETIEVIFAAENRVVYEAAYKLRGKRLKAPKLYKVHKNELGRIYVQNPKALWELNDCMSLLFQKGGRGEIEARLRAELPWVMETLGCVYEADARVERPKKGRITRIVDAAKKIGGKLYGN